MLFWALTTFCTNRSRVRSDPGARAGRGRSCGPGDRVGPEQQRQRVGVQLIGLHFGGRDRFDPRGVREDELDLTDQWDATP